MQTRAVLFHVICRIQGISYLISAVYCTKTKGSTESVRAETQKIKTTLTYLHFI